MKKRLISLLLVLVLMLGVIPGEGLATDDTDTNISENTEPENTESEDPTPEEDTPDVPEIIMVNSTTLSSVIETENDTVTVKWEAIEGASGYRIYRKEGSEDYQYVCAVSDTEYVDPNVKEGKTYTYCIKTILTVGEKNHYSAPSKELGTTLEWRPVIAEVNNVDGDLEIIWTPVEEAVSYQVYRSTDGNEYHFLEETTELRFLDTDIQTGTRYYYRLKAVYQRENKTFYSGLCEAVSSVGSRATTLTGIAETDNNTLTVSWNPESGATKYDIYRKTADGAFEYRGTSSGTSYADGGITWGETYTYCVHTIVTSGGKDYESPASDTCSHTALVRPVISDVDHNGTVLWGAVPGAVSYEVYRSSDGKNFTMLAEVTALTYTDASVVSGQNCYYKICAVYMENGERVVSGPSDIESAVTVLPTTITGCKTNAYGYNKLSWNEVKGVTKYRVYRKTATTSYIHLGDTTALSFTDKTPVGGETYIYLVRTIVTKDGSNYLSVYSNEWSHAGKAGPVISKVSRHKYGGLSVSWKSVANASGYYLFRSEDGKSYSTILKNTTATSYLDENVIGGTRYYYKVVAVLKDGTYTYASAPVQPPETVRDNVLAVAAGEVGVREDPLGSNKIKYNQWYYGWNAGGTEHPYCVVFVQWVFAHGDFDLPVLTASNSVIKGYAQNHGMWVTSDYQVGDIVLFNFDGDAYADHAGIVEKVVNGRVICIEGNTNVTGEMIDEGVHRKSRNPAYIVGAMRPDWP